MAITNGYVSRQDIKSALGLGTAAQLQSSRIYARRATPFGVAGSPEGGIVRLLSRLDPDVELMLRPYRVAREAL